MKKTFNILSQLNTKYTLFFVAIFAFMLNFVLIGNLLANKSNPMYLAEVTATEIKDFSSLSPTDLSDPVINITKSTNSNPVSPSKPASVSNDTSSAIGMPGQVLDINADSKDDVTRIIFEVDKDFSTEVKIINFPFRLMFDLPAPYDWKVPNSSLENPNLDKVVRTLRYGNPNSDVFRVIADLKVPVNIDRAFLVPYNKNYRFVIDLKPANMLNTLLNSNTLVVPSTEANYISLAQASNNTNDTSVNDAKRLLAINKWVDSYLTNVSYPLPVVEGKDTAKVLVVIDPGHGGKDPGAMPAVDSVINEKNIVLQIGKLVQANLLKDPEIKVMLTRRSDYFVPLKDRILWAEKNNADLFVSIHADRAVSNDSSGLSVYTLSEKASDAQTQVIATDQNKSDIIAGFDIGEEDNEVSRVLISLLQRVKVNDSVSLAKDVLASASTNIKLLSNPLRAAGFVVLQVPETPSILIETGFLSNNDDVTKLTNPTYQALVAQKVTDGIEKYLWEAGKLKVMPVSIKIPTPNVVPTNTGATVNSNTGSAAPITTSNNSNNTVPSSVVNN